jgi:hypothetical protein
MLVRADIRGAQATRLGRFLFAARSGSFPAGILFLENCEMNMAMVTSVVLLGAVLVHARKQGKGDKGQEKQSQGPSTPAQSASARDDKSKTTADSSPLARNDNAKNKVDAPPLPSVGRGDNFDFSANRVRHSYAQQILAPADRVFAVLEPVEEVKWAPGFEFEWVYSKEGPEAKSGHEGDVFITRHGEHDVVWVISHRDSQERMIQFVRFFPGVETVQIDIRVRPVDAQRSKCEIAYTWTAVSEHGRERLKQHTREVFERDMKEWEEQVNEYLSRR